ncbi:MAG: polyhydroxyalkanoic acid system family protein [Thermoguttaceae bacterium]|jgi:hypothetical protein
MPKLSVEVAHTLGRQEAIRRLDGQLGRARAAASDLQTEWHDNVLSFHAEALGAKIAGSVTVEDSAVRVAVDLPLVAMMIKGLIAERVRQELSGVLGENATPI